MILTAHPFPAMMKTSTTGYNTIPHVLCRENENENEKRGEKGQTSRVWVWLTIVLTKKAVPFCLEGGL